MVDIRILFILRGKKEFSFIVFSSIELKRIEKRVLAEEKITTLNNDQNYKQAKEK